MMSSRSFRGDALILGVCGLIALAAAAPTLLRETVGLAHWSARQAVLEGRPLTIDALSGLQRAQDRLSGLPDSAAAARLAARIAARRFDGAAEAAAWRRMVRLRPGYWLAWSRLAELSPPGPFAAHALRLSALSNAFEFQATPIRVDLGLRLWPYLDQGDRDAFGRMVLALWRWEDGRLAMIAAHHGARDRILPYLAPFPGYAERFERSYGVHRLSPVAPYPYD